MDRNETPIPPPPPETPPPWNGEPLPPPRDELPPPPPETPPWPTTYTPVAVAAPRPPTTSADPRCNPDLSLDHAYDAVFDGADAYGAYGGAPAPAAAAELQRQESGNDFWGACEGAFPKGTQPGLSLIHI